MNVEAFTQWFDSYAEGVINRPTYEQWNVIREKIASLSGNDLFTDHRGISKRHTNAQPLSKR